MNLNLTVFIQEIIHKNKGWNICNKSWWVWVNRNSLDSFVCECNLKVYFNSFWVEHIPKEIKKFIGNKSTIINIYRIKACNSIMCGYLYIGLIDFKLKGQSLLYYTN